MNSVMLFGACLCLLLMFVKAESWQSYGNFSDSNISLIRSTLQPTITDYEANMNNVASRMSIVKNISDTLNTVWNPAWNVIVFYQESGVDKVKSIVYGYAFNNHWLWYNDFTPKTSVILWKDYNCDTWGNLKSMSTGMNQATRT